MQLNSSEAGDLSEEEKRARNAALGQSSGQLNRMTNVADTTANNVNSSIEGFMGPNGLSSWKRGQLQSRTTDTNQAYNNAASQQRMRARSAGFGWEQPSEQAGETNIEMGRAGELSRIPGQVEAESVPITMNAAQLRLQSGAQQSGAHNQAAAGELGIASQYKPFEYYQTAVGLKQQEDARKAALWKSIIGSGAGIGLTALTGGFSKAIPKPVSKGYSV
jgi:hypothetical protein